MIKKINIYYYLILVFIISLILRLINIENFGLWQDELHTFFNVDPRIGNTDTFDRLAGLNGLYHREDNTVLYFFVLKYFLFFFDYTPFHAKILNIILGSFVPIIVYFICKDFITKKISLFCSFFVGINIFLIHQSQELRPSIFVVLIALISIYFFLNNINKNFTYKKYLVYIIINCLMLSSHPFTSFVLLGKSLYLLTTERFNKKFIILNLVFFLSFLLFCILNYDYIFERIDLSNQGKEAAYAQLELKFFINYFFRTFFGTILFGAFNLFLILYLIVSLKFTIYENKFLRFLSIQIFSIYLSLLFFTFFISPVIAPRYILFVLPLIIIWLIYAISLKFKSNSIYFLIFALTIFNMYFTLNNPYIPRPQTNSALNFILESNETKNVYSDNGILYDNYVQNHKQFHQNGLLFVNKDKINNNNKVWIICKNQPRSHFRTFNPELDECFLNQSNFKNINVKRFDPDYILKLYEKN